ncbi:MAG: hypothetical protein DWQ02_27160 [Bacteroidetes bacterium]|nr:MAG: hypothetical protein DWQ02_27160 [Bacteroidota bacterium]
MTQYEASEKHPYGQPSPEFKESLKDFAPMIGMCECKSVNRNPDGTWQDTVDMLWSFKYILNGTAIQDDTWKANGQYATSMRQFNTDSLKWVVTYFSSSNKAWTPGTWIGDKQGEDIILYMDQQAPNGMEGKSRLTFYDISNEGYKWKGEWIDKAETIVYPFWTIDCRKRQERK